MTEWSCDKCDYETTDDNKAAAHEEKSGHTMYPEFNIEDW